MLKLTTLDVKWQTAERVHVHSVGGHYAEGCVNRKGAQAVRPYLPTANLHTIRNTAVGRQVFM